jgi:hypothetical protein
MNDKTSMRTLLQRMRTGNPNYGINESKKKKEMSVRDMLKITRKLNEQFENAEVDTEEDEKEEKEITNKETVFDPKFFEKEVIELFKNTVSIEFKDFQVLDYGVIWGGIVNGVIQFVYVVTRDEITSRVEFNYLQGFSKDNPANDEIIEKLETYYETRFSKYVRKEFFKT